LKLAGRTVLVAGASAGIGAAMAEEAARRGAASVALMARRRERLEQVAGRVRAAGSEAQVVPVDLADHEAVARAADEVRAGVGVPDAILHSAGAGRWRFIDETSPDEFLQMNAAPYHAAFFLARAFTDDFLARGSGVHLIVNSPVSRSAWPGALGYASSRWALRGFTEALRADMHGTGVEVLEVVPAEVTSEYFAGDPESRARLPKIGRLAGSMTPEQCAHAALEALERGRRRAFMPGRWRALAAAGALTPGLTSRMMVLTGARRPRRP
jgi:short-subunit dehydrogenase